MERYGLVGKSLAHSFSRTYFTDKFLKEGIAATYHNFELEEVTALTSLCEQYPDLRGLNVTIPYKESIIPLLDRIDDEAMRIGAVNTVVFEGLVKVGYNTDAGGFRESIKPFLAHGMERALILGTGGASKAVAYVLKQIGIDVFFASRKPGTHGQLGYSDINANAMLAFRLIVNTTPLGTWPQVEGLPDLPYDHVGPQHLLYDLVYNPAETAFMKAGRARGATVLNGLDMLKMQAEQSWRLWNGQA